MDKRICVTLLPAFLACGCVASSNFYSGRTLEEGKYSAGFAADDIALSSTDPDLSATKTKPFLPSFSGAYGLPARLEIGARYYPISFFELTLRHQLNPRSFEYIDASLNLHFAHLIGGYSSLKYGVTISKNIHEIEPYVHYSAYSYLGATEEIFDGTFVSGSEARFINNNRVVGFGIALPMRNAKLYPEANYQYFGGDVAHGLWHFGIGIRVYPNQGPKND